MFSLVYLFVHIINLYFRKQKLLLKKDWLKPIVYWISGKSHYLLFWIIFADEKCRTWLWKIIQTSFMMTFALTEDHVQNQKWKNALFIKQILQKLLHNTIYCHWPLFMSNLVGILQPCFVLLFRYKWKSAIYISAICECFPNDNHLPFWII